MLRGNVPLPTKVKPSNFVDLVALDKLAVGLMCRPFKNIVDCGVTDERRDHSWLLEGAIAAAETPRADKFDS